MILAEAFYLQLNYGNLCIKFAPFVASFRFGSMHAVIEMSFVTVCKGQGQNGERLAGVPHGRNILFVWVLNISPKRGELNRRSQEF